MKYLRLQIPFFAICTAFALVSCNTTKNVNTNLPKDISERPADENSQKYDETQLEKLRSEIEKEIAQESCTNPDDWKTAPMGTKACGGPKTYIAYPKKLETTILPKIEDYNSKEAEFNKKYSIVSDCAMIAEPTGIKCNDGKAEVTYP